jgi:hypothetical protein
MAMLYDMTGQCCGNFEGDTAPEGYWLRANDLADTMTALQFLEKIGPARFANIWSVSIADPATAYAMVRGLAAQEIILAESFPVLVQMEQAGLLPAGTAIEVWS